MAIITPELARIQSNENTWLKLSVIARRALNCAIDNGKTKVRVHYRNHYQYFWNDIKILEQIGYEVDYFDGVCIKILLLRNLWTQISNLLVNMSLTLKFLGNN